MIFALWHVDNTPMDVNLTPKGGVVMGRIGEVSALEGARLDLESGGDSIFGGRAASQVQIPGQGTRPVGQCLANTLRESQEGEEIMGSLLGVLTREVADAKVSGLFYRAVVQDVLLCGSKTWVLSASMLSSLEGAHVVFSLGLAVLRSRWKRGEEWDCLQSESVLRAAGL